MKPRVLVVDDEKNIRRMLSMILSGAGYEVREAASGEDALQKLERAPSDVVLLDIGLPGLDGIATLKEIKASRSGAAVVMISGQATVQTAVEATRLGALDFLEKPLSKEHVLLAVRNAVRIANLSEEVDRLKTTESRRHVMIGAGDTTRSLRQQIERVGPTAATVLITGESGSGKEIVARALHEASPRQGGPFVKVNCAAIPEELVESELFGCVRGAFTGADRSRDGKFLQADGGTLFLDEIGDMSLKVQAKVLRALQEGEIERVGDSQTQRVDVRVLAASNKDLASEVRAGRFREDLYFRLAVIPVEVPPLRQRREDIPQLSMHFLELYAAENDLPVKELSRDALGELCSMEWRGNVRELRNVIERLAILSDGPRISRAEVQRLASVPALGGSPPGEAGAVGASTVAETTLAAEPSPAHEATTAASAAWPLPSLDQIRRAGGLVQARREFERLCIEMSLDRTGGNVSQAARWLGIERSNLHKKMVALGLEARPPRPRGHNGAEETPS